MIDICFFFNFREGCYITFGIMLTIKTKYVTWCCTIKFAVSLYIKRCLTHLGLDKIYNHFVGYIFTFIYFFENCCIPIQISQKSVSSGRINNNIALVQIMAWCQTGDKPLSEPKLSKINKTAPADLKQESLKHGVENFLLLPIEYD